MHMYDICMYICMILYILLGQRKKVGLGWVRLHHIVGQDVCVCTGVYTRGEVYRHVFVHIGTHSLYIHIRII